MTSAQRLRLVLALGVINLVLASVALGIGITGAPGPSIAIVQPTATAPNATGVPGNPTAPTPTPPESNPSSRPGGPAQSEEPGQVPTPSGEPAPSQSPEPSPLPSASPVSSTAPVVTVVQTPAPTADGANGGNAGGPKSSPTPPTPKPTPQAPKPTPRPTPRPTPTPEPPAAGSGHEHPCNASARGIEASNGKACGTKRGHGKTDHQTTHSNDHHGTRATKRSEQGQPVATVEDTKKKHSTRHRLRRYRRAR